MFILDPPQRVGANQVSTDVVSKIDHPRGSGIVPVNRSFYFPKPNTRGFVKAKYISNGRLVAGTIEMPPGVNDCEKILDQWDQGTFKFLPVRGAGGGTNTHSRLRAEQLQFKQISVRLIQIVNFVEGIEQESKSP